MSFKVLFGKRVKELRKERNYTQEKFSELIGIETRNLIKIEKGETFPRVQTLDKIMEVFDIPAEELFRFGHLDNVEVLKEKVIDMLNKDSRYVKMIYKMLY